MRLIVTYLPFGYACSSFSMCFLPLLIHKYTKLFPYYQIYFLTTVFKSLIMKPLAIILSLFFSFISLICLIEIFTTNRMIEFVFPLGVLSAALGVLPLLCSEDFDNQQVM
jgi:hypothetical protein